MTAECLGETGMSLKTKVTVVQEKGQQERRGDPAQEEESHNRKTLSGRKVLFIFIHFFHSSGSKESEIQDKVG